MPAEMQPHRDHAMIKRNASSAINWRNRSAAGSRFAFAFSFSFFFSAAREAGSAMT